MFIINMEINQPNIPNDIPMIAASSKNKKYSLNIARNRLDLIFNLADQPKDDEKNIKLILRQCEILIEETNKHIHIERIGIVSQHLYVTKNAPNKIYREYIKKEIDTTNLHETNLRYNTRELYSNLTINNITHILSIFQENKEGIQILRDINNIGDENFTFSNPDGMKFIKYYLPELFGDKVKELI